MPLTSQLSSRDTLNSLPSTRSRCRSRGYFVGGGILAVILLAMHHVLLRDASSIAEICIPTFIMAFYIIWVLYSAHRDKHKALRLATAVQLTEVMSEDPGGSNDVNSGETAANSRRDFKKKKKKKNSSLDSCEHLGSHENPLFTQEEVV